MKIEILSFFEENKPWSFRKRRVALVVSPRKNVYLEFKKRDEFTLNEGESIYIHPNYTPEFYPSRLDGYWIKFPPDIFHYDPYDKLGTLKFHAPPHCSRPVPFKEKDLDDGRKQLFIYGGEAPLWWIELIHPIINDKMKKELADEPKNVTVGDGNQ